MCPSTDSFWRRPWLKWQVFEWNWPIHDTVDNSFSTFLNWNVSLYRESEVWIQSVSQNIRHRQRECSLCGRGNIAFKFQHGSSAILMQYELNPTPNVMLVNIKRWINKNYPKMVWHVFFATLTKFSTKSKPWHTEAPLLNSFIYRMRVICYKYQGAYYTQAIINALIQLK